VALGGTAVGTGVNTHAEFAERVCIALSQELGVDVQRQQSLPGAEHAGRRSRDERQPAHGGDQPAEDRERHPLAGLGPPRGHRRLALPEVQPGSSIMPGKVNPVIAESVLQVVAQVVGNDAAIVQAAQGSYFELNMMMPVAAHNLLQAIELLAAAADNFNEQCISGLKATEKALRWWSGV
jgi:fumarate hydratase class II